MRGFLELAEGDNPPHVNLMILEIFLLSKEIDANHGYLRSLSRELVLDKFRAQKKSSHLVTMVMRNQSPNTMQKSLASRWSNVERYNFSALRPGREENRICPDPSPAPLATYRKYLLSKKSGVELQMATTAVFLHLKTQALKSALCGFLSCYQELGSP